MAEETTITNKTEPRVEVEFVINKSEKYAKTEITIRTVGEVTEQMIREKVLMVKRQAQLAMKEEVV